MRQCDTYVTSGARVSTGVSVVFFGDVVSRRDLLKFAAATPGLLGLGVAAASLCAAPASAASLGTLLDYAAGIIPASQIRAAGAVGAIRYVSDRRPGGNWMLGKPIQVTEARDLSSNGLKIVSCYQYGKGSTSDWLGGASAGTEHAKRGAELHTAAGGPANVPIYASIDDDPSYDQYKSQVSSVSAVLGVGDRTSAHGCLRKLENDRLGAARRPGLLFLAAQLGFAQGLRPSGGAPAPGRDR